MPSLVAVCFHLLSMQSHDEKALAQFAHAWHDVQSIVFYLSSPYKILLACLLSRERERQWHSQRESVPPYWSFQDFLQDLNS